jgi:hypothetical protein
MPINILNECEPYPYGETLKKRNEVHNYSCHTGWEDWEVLNDRSFGGEKENKALLAAVLFGQSIV